MGQALTRAAEEHARDGVERRPLRDDLLLPRVTHQLIGAAPPAKAGGHGGGAVSVDSGQAARVAGSEEESVKGSFVLM